MFTKEAKVYLYVNARIASLFVYGSGRMDPVRRVNAIIFFLKKTEWIPEEEKGAYREGICDSHGTSARVSAYGISKSMPLRGVC